MLWPASNGESLREFNQCHDPETGRFAGAGRCGPVNRADRRNTAIRMRAVRRARDEARLSGLDPVVPEADQARLARLAGRRKALRSIDTLPAYLRPDALRARKEHRISVSIDPTQRGASSAMVGIRDVRLEQGMDRAEGLSALRHEIGHVMPDNFARMSRVVGIDLAKLTDKVEAHFVKMIAAGASSKNPPRALAIFAVNKLVEEIRAWRNAVKFGGGRLDWGRVASGIRSYVTLWDQAGGYGPPGPKVGYNTYIGRTRIANQVVRHLKRYARMVRRQQQRAA